MDDNGSTFSELQGALKLSAKLYPDLENVKWPFSKKGDIYSIGMKASDEKWVDKHFTSGDGENKTKIIGEVDYEKERIQAINYGDRKGGGVIEFGDSEMGIEGYFISENSSKKIPLSLKKLVTKSPINVFRDIRQNAKKVRKASVKEGSGIKLGEEVNTEINVVLENIKKKDLLEFIESSKPNIFPQQGTFKEIVIETTDGLLKFDKNNKLID